MESVNVHLVRDTVTVTDGTCTPVDDIHAIGGAILDEGQPVMKSLTTAAVASIRTKKPLIMTPDIAALFIEAMANRE